MHDDYVYNSKNELTSITSFIRGIRQKQVSFTYDVFGRRLSKKTKNFIANESKPDSQTNFLWNGHILLAEDRVEIGDKSDFTTFSKYYIHRPYSFEVLAQVIREYRDDPEGEYLPQVEQDCFYYYHNDHIGTPQELTDEQGNIVWQAEYLAYGKIRKLEANRVENNIRFQGQ